MRFLFFTLGFCFTPPEVHLSLYDDHGPSGFLAMHSDEAEAAASIEFPLIEFHLTFPPPQLNRRQREGKKGLRNFCPKFWQDHGVRFGFHLPRDKMPPTVGFDNCFLRVPQTALAACSKVEGDSSLEI